MRRSHLDNRALGLGERFAFGRLLVAVFGAELLRALLGFALVCSRQVQYSATYCTVVGCTGPDSHTTRKVAAYERTFSRVAARRDIVAAVEQVDERPEQLLDFREFLKIESIKCNVV